MHTFYDNEEFCKRLFKQDHFIAISHNCSGYDGVFLTNYMLNSLTSFEKIPHIIATPTKILQIKFRNVMDYYG
jgi:hypothetical protein